jgi:hypothetical protein
VEVKMTIRELTWNQLKRENDRAYYAFDEVVAGCEFNGDTPDRSAWDLYYDELGLLHASCEPQPVASVIWFQGKWRDENEECEECGSMGTELPNVHCHECERPGEQDV